MSIFLPISGGQAAAVHQLEAFTLAGQTGLAVTPQVARSFAATLAGRTLLAITPTATYKVPVALAGGTALAITPKLAGEPNASFGVMEFASAAGLTITPALAINVAAVLASGTLLAVTPSITREEEPSFTFVVTVIDAALAAAQDSNTRSYSARLFANGTPIPVVSLSINAPPDAMGLEVSAVLASADAAALFPLDAVVDVEVGLWDGSGFIWQRFVSGGALSARSRRLLISNNLPADTVEVNIVDIVADRWNRAPRQNVFVYDPDKVARPSDESLREQNVYTSAGAVVSAQAVAVSNLRLHEVLRRAYVEGCGFSAVRTNIENFPVEQVSFTLSGGYDAAVRPLLQAFTPVRFPVSNDLWIVDADTPLPAGLAARAATLSSFLDISDTFPSRVPTNAIIVRLRRETSGGEFFTERVETETTSTGQFGSPGYTSTLTERRVREYRSDTEPWKVVREEVVSLKTTITDHEFRVISRETQVDSLDNLGRRSGYARTVEMLLPDLNADGTPLLQTAEEEDQVIYYDPLDPARDRQSRVETRTAGLILVDNDNEYLGRPFRLPFLDAHRSGQIDTDADQTTEFGEIRTTVVSLRGTGGQLQRERRVINHISNAPDIITVEPVPGSSEVSRARGAGTRAVLLTVAGTDGRGRRAAEFDGTALPNATALRLAGQKLVRLNSPPRELQGQMTFADLTMRRGLELILAGRGGVVLGKYIVRGWTLTVRRAEGGAVEALMSIQARERVN